MSEASARDGGREGDAKPESDALDQPKGDDSGPGDREPSEHSHGGTDGPSGSRSARSRDEAEKHGGAPQ